MSDQTREARLAGAFVKLADTLVADFDLLDLLHTLVDTCADVLDTRAAGLLLRSRGGELQLVASTTEDAAFVELVQLAAASGPCLDCVQTGKAVSVPDIASTGDQWPEFRDAALQRGFKSLQATPMRLRDDVIGTMNLLNTEVGALNDVDTAAAQALSDVATIGILSERAIRDRDTVTAQLQGALDSRVLIEQAKGIISQSASLTMDESFKLLRSFARGRNVSIRDVSSALIERRLDVSRLMTPSATRSSSIGPN